MMLIQLVSVLAMGDFTYHYLSCICLGMSVEDARRLTAQARVHHGWPAEVIRLLPGRLLRAMGVLARLVHSGVHRGLANANHALTHYVRLDIKGEDLTLKHALGMQKALAPCNIITSKEYHVIHRHNLVLFLLPQFLVPTLINPSFTYLTLPRGVRQRAA